MATGVVRATATALLLAALALALVWALRPETGRGEPGVNDAVAGEVYQVSVDMDVTGNPAGSGGLLSAIQASAGPIPIGQTHEFDVIVDEVDPADGMSGAGFDLKYDENVVAITGKNIQFILSPAIEFVPEPLPSTDGNYRVDPAQIGANLSGEGVLVRFTVECVGNGTSPIDLADDIGGDGVYGVPDILDPFGTPVEVLNAFDGEITCGSGATPSATASSTVAPSPTASPTATTTTTPAPSPTSSPAVTTPAATVTSSPQVTETSTLSPAPSPSETATATPPAPPTTTATTTVTPTANPSQSSAPTATALPSSPTATPTATPTTTPESTPAATATPAATVTPEPADQVVWGDDNCSGAPDPVDSLLTLRYDAGLATNTGACPAMGQQVGIAVASPRLWGDVDCSDAISPVDSLKLLRYDAGLAVSQAGGCPAIGALVPLS